MRYTLPQINKGEMIPGALNSVVSKTAASLAKWKNAITKLATALSYAPLCEILSAAKIRKAPAVKFQTPMSRAVSGDRVPSLAAIEYMSDS